MSDAPALPPGPVWQPDESRQMGTNLGWLMERVGVSDYPALHAWTCQNREAYWTLVLERLGIRLRQPYRQILDVSTGVENPRWLAGARLNIVDSCFGGTADSPAIVEQNESGRLERMTIAELDELSNRVAHGLTARGIQPGDAIGLLLPMTAQAVAIYLGIIKRGAVAVGIPESFGAAEIAVRLRLADARLIIVQHHLFRSGKRHELYERIRECAAPPAIVIAAGHESAALRTGDIAWEEFLGAAAPFPVPSLDPDSPLNILFSSGTTGDPKAIPWSHLSPIKCAADAHFHHDIHAGDVLAWPTSMGWMMGPWLVFASLLNRASMAIYTGAPTDLQFGRFVKQAGVTMLGAVPSLVSAWRSRGIPEGHDWSGIRCFSSTGECSRPDDMRWLMEVAGGRPVIEYCGGTEIAGGYITGTVVQPAIPSTFSTPALGLDFVLLDDQGKPADQGEIFLIPPSIGLSTHLLNRDHHAIYYEGCPPGPHGEILRRHGDAMERLANGYWRAHGRVDDTMNLGGIKVSSAEIERILNRVPGVLETAAVAEEPAGGGPTQLVIFAVASATLAAETLLEAMQTAIRRDLNPLFKIERLEIVPALPRTASNKVMRRMLRRSRNEK